MKVKNRIDFFTNDNNLLRMLPFMRNREVVFMDRKKNEHCIRGLRATTINILKQHFQAFNYAFDFYKEDYNIYISCAKFRFIPVFTYNLRDRSKETNNWFKEEAKNSIYSFDLILDFDIKKKQTETFRNEVFRFYKFLENENIKFYIISSGTGFQINIPSEIYGFNGDFEKPLRIAEQFKKRFNLKYLDLKGVNNFTKFIKCPFSLVGLEIAYIITDKHLSYFHNSTKEYKDFQNFCLKYHIKEVV